MHEQSGNRQAPEPRQARSGDQRTARSIGRVIAKVLIAAFCGVAGGATAGLVISSLRPGPSLGMRDFVVYWATARQLAHHANPYDRAALFATERSVGLFTESGALFMRNPPSALPFVLPFGYLGLQGASILWFVLQIAALAVSVHMLWRMHGSPKNRRALLGYTFGPALICLINGQTSIFVLLGLVLFLRFHRDRPLVAGAALCLCALKPHLFLPFGAVLVTWTVFSKSYKVLAGAVAGMAASCAIAACIDPRVFSEYMQMARSSGIERDFIPCPSYMLRLWASPEAIWLQYLPAALGCAWALGYYWRRRGGWDWTEHGGPLLLVSVLAAPYCWLCDQVIAIPALLHGAYLTRSRALLASLALLSASIEATLFANRWNPGGFYLWTLWSTPAWLAWYLVARGPADGVWRGIVAQGWQWLRGAGRLEEPSSEASPS